MSVPRHVMWFQVCLYLSLVLDAVSVAFQDRTPTASITETTILAANVISACMILLFAYLVRLAAQQRKNWPRWVLAAALGFSGLSLLQVIRASGLQFDSAIEAVSCTLTAAGLYASCTGDAKGWFNA
jgi:protein-S-isoprenylcysteine O-methyltransferase Ste14